MANSHPLALLLRFKIEKNEQYPDQFKCEYFINNSPLTAEVRDFYGRECQCD